MAIARELLRIPEPLPPFGRLFSIREYLDRERVAVQKSEYIAGEILAMAGGSPLHALIASDVLVALSNALRSAGSGCRATNSDLMVRVADGGPIFYPDVTVTCGEMVIDDDDCLRNPIVVVEVLSPSTQGYDRGEKFRLYRQISSLRHYLVIAQNRVFVEKYVHHEGDLWTLAETYTSIDDVVRLEELGVEISVSQIYESARFREGQPNPVRAEGT